MSNVMLSMDARNAATNAVCALLDGGSLLLTGPANEPLAKLKLSNPAFQPAQDGTALAAPMSTAIGQARGMVASWQALDAAGQPVMAGDGLAGGPVEVFTGGTVRIEGFSYSYGVQ